MRTKVIYANDIKSTAARILDELFNPYQRNNVIYFDGWDGLGASAVLREIGRIINEERARVLLVRALHVDCSKWESKRALQRALAVQLELPAWVLQNLDARDEKDDYDVDVVEGSRDEIPEVCEGITRHVQRQDITFVVIFHNGSDEEVHLKSLGFPLPGEFIRHKVLWSFQGRFRRYPRAKVDAALAKTNLFLSADYSGQFNDLEKIIREEAEELTCDIDLGSVVLDSPATAAANCLLYMTKLSLMGNYLTDYDLATHGINYCICDGVIQLRQQGDVDNDGADHDRLWQWSDALKREMRLDTDYYQNPHSPSPVPAKTFLRDRMAFWASPTYGFTLIPASQHRRIPQGMFLPFDGLCVLKLYYCVFSFKSPPFRCCHRLRFLWIEKCQEEKDEEAADEEDLRRCFQRLWVLHVRDTSAFLSAKTKMMGFITNVRELNVIDQDHQDPLDLSQGQLPNVQKLRVANSSVTTDGLPLGMDKLELLSFTGSLPNMEKLTVVSGCRSLLTVSIQGDGNHSFLKDISLKGCTNLKNLSLGGSFRYLESLDISGTAVKTLDLSGVEVPKLDKLFLFDCGNLCKIQWPPQGSRWTNLVHLGIDTIRRDLHDDAGRSTPRPAGFGWYIAARDARLLWSFEKLKDDLDHKNVHLDISTIMSSSSRPTSDADGSKDDRTVRCISGQQEVQVANNMQQQQLQSNNNNATIYADIAAALTFKDDNSMQQQANDGDSEPLDVMCICPPPPCFPPSQGCYLHLEDQQVKSSQAAIITVSGFICDSFKILHIHDSQFITTIRPPSLDRTAWRQLVWCRVERCPKLKYVFSGRVPADGSAFNELRTIWASRLSNAHSIWLWRLESFMMDLTFLHLDRCPRLNYAVWVANAKRSLRSLETLEITFCGDLGVVFLIMETTPSSTWELPELKHIHLHELPKLRYIGALESDVIAPKLETIKIRGCWSLKRLPFAGGKNTVQCDCEKEWWDALEWRSKAHAESYMPTHPRYYKKKMLRGSVLR